MIAGITLALFFGYHHHTAEAGDQPGSPKTPHPIVLPLCITAEAKLTKTLSSNRNNAGDVFPFKLVGPVVGHGDVPDIKAGTPGYGVISFAMHARMAGGAGFFVLEPRYLTLHDGRHLPAMADPRLDDQIISGASRNAPGALGFVPILGWAAAGYNAIHRGKEVVIPAGTQLRLVLGDDLLLKRCADPPVSD